jgi:hypothetical protein
MRAGENDSTAGAPCRLYRAGAGVALAIALGAIAAATSQQRLPDSFYYERIAEQTIVPGCGEIHCFRPLVPWTLGLLPAGLAKWKAYAVLGNVGAALAVFDLCLLFGMTRRASAIAASLSALGFGSLYTLFEPFTSDPLMFWLAPLTTRALLYDRAGHAAALTCVGVFAKEFVVAPVVIVALADARAGRWAGVRRAVIVAGLAFVVWLTLHYWLMHAYGYTYGDNKSPRLSSGSYLVFWLRHETVRGALSAMFVEFGALYLLIPFGFRRAPRRLKELVVAAIPIACVFAYVQQPDRALWNFHYLTSPLSALVLERLPNVLVVAFVVLFGVAYLRIGAQVMAAPEAKYALALSLALAVAAIVADLREPGGLPR